MGSTAECVGAEGSFGHAAAVAPGPAVSLAANQLFRAHLAPLNAGALLNVPFFRYQALLLRL